ncbi:hypothetical protein Pst134EA_015137 [Puccinia striiformis f. sp. tritici]|uniref:hypothetical protein n=1 Tax=Puccinia striiformis f. sp. tritici TaxID=168172 RepID=UPI0020073A9C|nr:hypothetical protein Pst134EA_015137 [Puccinia striiformis f. sp. tritici]KAH9463050.1 hypothetical protein Pst134EA_015137 [Puccinia striiformis f. sp. tritici]
MDDDEAFLYGDDAPETTSVGVSKLTSAQPVEPAVHPIPLANAPRKSLSPVPSNIPASSDQIHRAFEIASNALIPPQPLLQPLPSHSPEPAAAQLNQPDPPQAVVLDHSQPQSISVAATGLVDEEDGEDDEDAVDEQGILEDSDEDLDIILEGDTSVAPTAPPSRPPTQPMRFDTPRDSVPLGRPSQAQPYHPAPGQSIPSTRPRPNNQNRLPTPENFPVAVTPPPQPPAELKPPDLETENPVIPSGYDDKDGSTLMNFDFDGLPESEKGWKKPGAHLADWFNYGFDETTWRTYVMRQKKLRKEEGWATNPFAAFAMGNIEQAWEGLPPELKDVMMGVIMGNSSGSRNNNHAPQMPPSIPPMMVMNPMMQGMDMGGYGMQGMPNMMRGGNPQMNGGHNPGLNNQHNDGASRVVKQDPGGASEQTEDSPALYGEGMDPREQHHHEQQRIQDQMRHMQHMHHMGMGAGFMPGMDLAAMFGNQEHPMFMNGPPFNGMMEMPHLQHIPPHMQQQQQQHQQQKQQQQQQQQKPQPQPQPIAPGPPINMIMPPNPNFLLPSAPLNAGLPAPPTTTLDPPSIPAPVPSSAQGLGTNADTPGGSPGVAAAMSSPASARGRTARPGGWGRGNAQASAFLAAAAARGRGRVISASNSIALPIAPLPATPTETPKIGDPPVQGTPTTVPSETTPPSPAPPTVEGCK